MNRPFDVWDNYLNNLKKKRWHEAALNIRDRVDLLIWELSHMQPVLRNDESMHDALHRVRALLDQASWMADKLENALIDNNRRERARFAAAQEWPPAAS
jgi:hypothetical protein